MFSKSLQRKNFLKKSALKVIFGHIKNIYGTDFFLNHRLAYVYKHAHGGARCGMVIVVGNGHDDTSSNPGRDWLHFT